MSEEEQKTFPEPPEPLPPSAADHEEVYESGEATFEENAETHEGPEIVEILDENIVWIEIGTTQDVMNKRYPYTRMDIPELGFEYSSNEKYYDDDTFRCYCIVTKEYITIDFDACLYYHYHNTRDLTIEKITSELKQIEETAKELPDIDKQLIIDTKYRRWLETETDLVWDSYKFTEFKIDNLEKIYSDDVDTALFDEIRDWYMNKIRCERELAFVELDELEMESKNAGAAEEDLQDIDTIKQMFRDIPQDIDLQQFKTIGDMFDFWPSLLQPRKLGCIDPVLRSILVHEDPVDDLKEMLSKCTSDDLDELESLLKYVHSTIPQGVDLNDWSIDLLEKRIEELKTPGI